jgi:hypothetical protein
MRKKIKEREIDPAVYDKAIEACRLICLGYEAAWNSNEDLLSAYRAASEALQRLPFRHAGSFLNYRVRGIGGPNGTEALGRGTRPSKSLGVLLPVRARYWRAPIRFDRTDKSDTPDDSRFCPIAAEIPVVMRMAITHSPYITSYQHVLSIENPTLDGLAGVRPNSKLFIIQANAIPKSQASSTDTMTAFQTRTNRCPGIRRTSRLSSSTPSVAMTCPAVMPARVIKSSTAVG